MAVLEVELLAQPVTAVGAWDVDVFGDEVSCIGSPFGDLGLSRSEVASIAMPELGVDETAAPACVWRLPQRDSEHGVVAQETVYALPVVGQPSRTTAACSVQAGWLWPLSTILARQLLPAMQRWGG